MRTIIPTLCILSLLGACSAEPDSGEQPAPAPVEVAAAPDAVPVDVTEPAAEPADTFDTGISIRTLMNTMVQPNADRLWKAVRYVVTEEGVTEDVAPQTAMDWSNLRQSAVTLIEAGNALMLPGRPMDSIPPGPDYPDFQFLPGEMQAMMESDPEGWRYFIQEMQFSTRDTLEAIENRDILGLIDTGARINQSCQGCHAEFWYRPNNP